MASRPHKLAAMICGPVLAISLTPLALAARHSRPLAADSAPVATPMTQHVAERPMQWFWRRPSARDHETWPDRFGSTAVVGLGSMRDLDSLREKYGFAQVRALPALHAAVVKADAGELRGLVTDSRVRYVSPLGAKRRISSMPNDPLVQAIDPMTKQPFEWQFTASHADRALDYSRGDAGVVVGVIDTGAVNVPDLAGKMEALWSASPEGALTSQPVSEGNDDNGHGTAVASVIAANVDDGFGMAGFGGEAHVIVVHAGDQGFLYDTAIAIAIAKLDALGARIVNISAGGRSPSEPILVDAMRKAVADGMLLVASAGNDSHGPVSWPAADLQPSGGGRSFGLAVGASDTNGRLAGFSNSGEHLSLVAPGIYGPSCSGVLVALPPANVFQDGYCYPLWDGLGGASYGYLAGTSFAAPQVAGIAALIWAARPELRNYEVADIVKQSARRAPGVGWTSTMGCGILDAGAALELATSFMRGRPAADPNDATTCSTQGNDAPQWLTELDQSITFGPLPDRTLGDPDFEVRATASSDLTVSFSASGACIVHVATVHLTGTGTCSITASQPGHGAYARAMPVTRAFSITRARRSMYVIAEAASAQWGSPVTLSFRIVRASRGSVARVTVRNGQTTVARLIDGLPVAGGRVYSLSWRPPTGERKGKFTFCVTVTDDAHRSRTRSCAPIRLR